MPHTVVISVVSSLVVLGATLGLWRELVQVEESRLQQLVEGKVILASGDVASALENRAESLERMAQRWLMRGGTPQREWENDALLYAQHEPGFELIMRIDADRRAVWSAPKPGGQEQLTLEDAQLNAALDAALSSGETYLTQTWQTSSGSAGLLMVVPLLDEGEHDGFLVAELGFEALFSQMLPDELAREFAIAILDDGNLVFGPSPKGELYLTWMESRSVRVRNSEWVVAAWPREPLIAEGGFHLPAIVLGVGAIVAVLIGLTIYFAQKSSMRADELESVVQARTSELRSALEALQESEEKYQQLYESAPDMFFSVEPRHGRIIQCNQTMADTLGYEKADLLNRQVWELYHPDFRERGREAFREFVRTGEVQDVELQLQTAADGTLDVLLNASAVRNEAGEILYSSSIWRDISGRVQAERERDRLLVSEREQRRVAQTLGRVGLALSATLEFESLVELICKESVSLFDVGAAFVWLVEGNELVGKAGYGEGREHFIGARVPLRENDTLGARVIHQRRPLYVNHAQGTDSLNRNLVELFKTQAILGVPLLKGFRPIGSLMILDLERPDRFGPDDLEIATVLGSHVAVAVENARLYEQEKQLAQMKDDFIAHVSHELRTPLHTLRGFIDLLGSGKVTDRALQQDFLARAAHDTDRLSEQVSALLDAAHIDAAGLTLAPENTDFNEIINQTVESIRIIARDRGVQVTVEQPPHPAIIYAEPRRLRQVVRNLVENAIQFSEANSEVLVTLRAEGDHLLLSVRDQGPGIPEGARDQLFDRFYQVKTPARREKGGVGLGLYISRMIVEAHGGTIDYESELGAGTTFQVRLPVGVVEPLEVGQI